MDNLRETLAVGCPHSSFISHSLLMRENLSYHSPRCRRLFLGTAHPASMQISLADLGCGDVCNKSVGCPEKAFGESFRSVEPLLLF